MPNYLDYAGLTRYDGKIKLLITANSSAITNEATARGNADNALSSRITTLENAGFITNAVNDLVNYYKKTETYTKAEINALLDPLSSALAINVTTKDNFNDNMAAVPQQYYGTGIWLVRQSEGGTPAGEHDYYFEYIVARTGTSGNYTYAWEKIGDTNPNLSGYVPTSRTVNGHALTSNITITATDISDVYSKTEVNSLLDNKVDKISGKGLSTNDYTTAEKNKLANIASGAQVNVIESIKKNGTALTITSKAVDISVPTKTSDLTNDSGFITGVSSITNAEIDALF